MIMSSAESWFLDLWLARTEQSRDAKYAFLRHADHQVLDKGRCHLNDSNRCRTIPLRRRQFFGLTGMRKDIYENLDRR
jgi:hypothetical protein